jgi:hypothetical protein
MHLHFSVHKISGGGSPNSSHSSSSSTTLGRSLSFDTLSGWEGLKQHVKVGLDNPAAIKVIYMRSRIFFFK